MSKVRFGLSEHSLGREERAVVFEASDADGKIGELHVSRGGLRWYPKNSRYHHFVRWRKFAEVIEANARKTP
jgi:hypothetical protein